MFVPEEEIQQVNLVWGNQGGLALINIIIMWGGGLKLIFA